MILPQRKIKSLPSPHVIEQKSPKYHFPIPETISFFVKWGEMSLDHDETQLCSNCDWEGPAGDLRASIWKAEMWGNLAILVMISTTGDWTEPRICLYPENMIPAKTLIGTFRHPHTLSTNQVFSLSRKAGPEKFLGTTTLHTHKSFIMSNINQIHGFKITFTLSDCRLLAYVCALVSQFGLKNFNTSPT